MEALLIKPKNITRTLLFKKKFNLKDDYNNKKKILKNFQNSNTSRIDAQNLRFNLTNLNFRIKLKPTKRSFNVLLFVYRSKINSNAIYLQH
ncbi:hypothetical protein BpHYR1_042640 [Brachionus plicatilis]|uniref:Uncharacterized protein n=1 Tax=Brachionus plicatilis TaxID=10195 RepID=A0A3M7T8B3_BRAPC|nr:hypothetical protein BpHYR1_042640 [Brachionus plicatilis]